MKALHLSFIVIFAALLVAGCADPRTQPPTASEPAYTKTVVLWEDVLSGGEAKSASFVVDSALASASLTIAGFIAPDDDILWYEAILDDSIPGKDDEILDILVQIDGLGPDSLWSHDDSLLFDSLSAAMDSLDGEKAAIEARGDSLIKVVDDRFVLSLWLDEDAHDSTARYPDAVYLDEDTLSGQHFYASPTDSASGMKGRSFQLNLRQWSAADPAFVGRPIEINWLSELAPGEHTFWAKLTEVGSRVTGTIVLVYREGEI